MIWVAWWLQLQCDEWQEGVVDEEEEEHEGVDKEEEEVDPLPKQGKLKR